MKRTPHYLLVAGALSLAGCVPGYTSASVVYAEPAEYVYVVPVDRVVVVTREVLVNRGWVVYREERSGPNRIIWARRGDDEVVRIFATPQGQQVAVRGLWEVRDRVAGLGVREPVADQRRVGGGICDVQSRAKLVLRPHRVLQPERRGPRVQRDDDVDVLFPDAVGIAPGIEIVADVAKYRPALWVRNVEQLPVLALEMIQPGVRRLLGDEQRMRTSARAQHHAGAESRDRADEPAAMGGNRQVEHRYLLMCDCGGAPPRRAPPTASRPACTAHTGRSAPVSPGSASPACSRSPR